MSLRFQQSSTNNLLHSQLTQRKSQRVGFTVMKKTYSGSWKVHNVQYVFAQQLLSGAYPGRPNSIHPKTFFKASSITFPQIPRLMQTTKEPIIRTSPNCFHLKDRDIQSITLEFFQFPQALPVHRGGVLLKGITSFFLTIASIFLNISDEGLLVP